ncbi:MAG: sensor histidine kinase [Burkholderiales bacterium]|nr:MAG: sensor histidine kinase [Burkholderiales bacterium]
MQADSQFIDNYVAAVQDEQSQDVHDAWVDMRLAQDFMLNAAASMRASSLVIPLTVLLLYGHVHVWVLFAWAVAASGILIYRHTTIKSFDRLLNVDVMTTPVPDIGVFFKRYGWSWSVSAFLFAFPMFLYYEHAPLAIQYLCMLVLVTIGTLGASLMAARIQIQRQFAHTLCGTVILAVSTHWAIYWPTPSTITSGIFLLMVAIFWVLMLYLGKHLHALQRSSYSAQFGHEQLIRSLRQQTQASTEAVQTKNNLLASAAHDLRQPVHALAFYADWLRNEPDMAESVVPKILAATDSVNTLFNSLFDFARIESGAIKINIEDVDIESLLEEMTVQFAPAADAKGLSLSTSAVQATVRSDPVLLRRITSNLLANAIRYTDHGGVMLSAQVVGDQLWLEVSDSGTGISAEHLPHVFKEFYRATAHEGTADSFGLGLAIVKRLCRALGHSVSLRSVVGKGTSCRLEIQLKGSALGDTLGKPDELKNQLRINSQIMPLERAQ